MNPAPSYQGADPLELARRQLDFARLAQDAPSTREILFKAQTIVPISPVKPWTKLAKAAGALAVLSALVFAPWMPQRSSLVTVNAFFDTPMERPQAQELINKIECFLPEEMLLGAAYTPQGITPPNSDVGTLKLSFTTADRPGSTVLATAEKLIKGSNTGLSSQQIVPVQMGGVKWHSPYQLVHGAAYKRQAPQAPEFPGSKLAARVLRNQDLVGRGLAEELEMSKCKLTGFHYLDAAESGSGERDSFVLPAWPGRVELEIRNYGALTVSEQSEIRSRAEHFLARINLGVGSAQLADQPTLWQPIIVEVLGPGGMSDRYLSDRLQAYITQPDTTELTDYAFDPIKRVEDAVKVVLPGWECRIDYFTDDTMAQNSPVQLYRFNVSLTGAKVDTTPNALDEMLKKESSIEY